MNNQPRPTSWWHTLPGMLTALAGVITAVTGLVIALNQLGVFGRGEQAVTLADSTAGSPLAGGGGEVVEATRSPASPPPSRSAAAQGIPVLEATLPEVRVGQGRYQIRAVTTERRSSTAYSLKLDIRLFNESGYDIGFWDDSFRLFIDSVPRAPVSGLSVAARSRAATDGQIEFVVPAAANTLVLQVSYQGEEAEVPLRRVSSQ